MSVGGKIIIKYIYLLKTIINNNKYICMHLDMQKTHKNAEIY